MRREVVQVAVTQSDEFDRNVPCVSSERFDVGFVSGEHGATRLGERDDEGMESG